MIDVKCPDCNKNTIYDESVDEYICESCNTSFVIGGRGETLEL